MRLGRIEDDLYVAGDEKTAAAVLGIYFLNDLPSFQLVPAGKVG